MVTVLQYDRHGLLLNTFCIKMAAVQQKKRVGDKSYNLIIQNEDLIW